VRLNLGCGRRPLDGWTNLDRATLPGVDVVHDLDDPLPFDDDTVSEILGIDLIEHIADPLALMGELWRVATPDATCTFELPYGSSDDAWEDPTHVRPYFIDSWLYFAQPTYFRADYGYRGDWQPETLTLAVNVDIDEDTLAQVMALRNVVKRQSIVLRAVKPARPCDRSLMVKPTLNFEPARR
jgi:SAM-dependent methyltransferase